MVGLEDIFGVTSSRKTFQVIVKGTLKYKGEKDFRWVTKEIRVCTLTRRPKSPNARLNRLSLKELHTHLLIFYGCSPLIINK